MLIIHTVPLSWGSDAVSIVDMLLATAAQQCASDIHLQPSAEYVAIRFRINGLLQPIHVLTHQQAAMVTSRLKVLTNKDIMQTQQAQDGSLRVLIVRAHYDVRISFFPSLYGEKVVVRLLGQQQAYQQIATLGVPAAFVEQLNAVVRQTQGFFLATGPTGAGKTTTLYALLRAVDRQKRNVVTLEDPIEYRIDGVTQTPVNTIESFRFADAMRCLLRQDPDVALIGEIRDQETACSAIEAALTGHLVLSSVHATHASAVPIRLKEMGVPAYLIASSLTGVLAQRLVPLLCEECKEQTMGDTSSQRWLQQQRIVLPAHWQARGCNACHFTGVQGRTIVAELFVPDQEARTAMVAPALTRDELQAQARRCGMVSMHSHGLTLVMAGKISLASLIQLGL